MNQEQSMDKSNLLEILENYPKQLEEGVKLAKDVNLGKPEKIIIAGMGGSALPADLVKTCYPNLDNLSVYRDYTIPKTDSNTLLIVISYSGNTEETLTVFQEALKQNIDIITISSGGKLKHLSEENKIQTVTIPSGIQPRYATGYIFSALATILEKATIINNTAPDMLALSEELKRNIETFKTQGKHIAETIGHKIPIIYTTKDLYHVARIMKIKFNESGKSPAFFNTFPELNHNEMVGFTTHGNKFHVLNLYDPSINDQMKKRIDATKEVLESKGIQTTDIEITGSNNLEKVFNTLYLGDFITYYFAIQRGIDPTPVDMVEELKDKLQ